MHGGDSKFFTCVGLSKVSLRSSDPRTPSESNLRNNDVPIDSLEKLHEDRAKIRMKGPSQLRGSGWNQGMEALLNVIGVLGSQC